jgi:hypothetical protein
LTSLKVRPRASQRRKTLDACYRILCVLQIIQEYAPGPDRSGLFCAQAKSVRRVRTPFPTGSGGQPGHAITRQGLLDQNLHRNRLSLRDFARESASSSPMRQSDPFSARAWTRRRRDAVLLLCPCYSPRRIAPSRAKWALPRTSHCIFPVINNGRALDCTPFGATGTTVEFRSCYSAAVCRRPNWRNERSTQSRVSFSCTPFWARRARRLSKSTRSRS